MEKVADLMNEQLFAVLSTTGTAGLHSVIVSFVSADDMREILFLTPRQTRKFHNIMKYKEVTLFIDNRSNRITDTQRTIGVEAVGRAEEADEDSRERYRNLYLQKYPEMCDFAEAQNTALIKITVDRYEVVQHFQNVTILEIK